jgi:predicted RecA/RadA family phage recombinase
MAECVMRATGDRIDYTPSGADVEPGQVVDLGTFVGVATEKILDGEPGSLQVEGVGDFLKYTGEAINLGDVVYWDEGTNTATKTSGYSEAPIGKCFKAALAGDATVRVKLMPGLSTT